MKLCLILTFLFAQISLASDLDEIIENAGCPFNTSCTKEQGQQRRSLRDLLLTSPSNKKLMKFFKKNGTPVNFFITGKVSENEFIMYDSKCPNHNLKDQTKITIGQKFIKNFKELNQYQENIFIPKVTILTSKNKPITIPLSQGVFPSFLNGQSIYSTMDFEGNYYGLTVSAKGKISISKAVQFDKHPEKIACPTELESYYKTQSFAKNLTKGHYCRKIWDKKTRKYVPALFSHYCN